MIELEANYGDEEYTVLADLNKLSPADGALLRQYCAEKIEKM